MATRSFIRVLVGLLGSVAALAASENVSAQSARGLEARAARVIEHWTPARMAAAIPRDLVIDSRGLGYLRAPGNTLVPYGHNIPAVAADHGQAPMAKPGSSGDTTGPSVTNMSPAAGATITSGSQTFSATVTDASGVKSVSISVRKGTGAAQSFAAGQGANNVWSVSLSGFTDGDWTWWVVAQDRVKQGGGNTTTTSPSAFTVAIGGGGGGGGGTVPNAEWTNEGVVQSAAGRIYFEMPDTAARIRWSGYVCSGTAVNDGTAGRSIILTAAHCVYDDANKSFARNALFIPDQAGTTAAGTDLNCANDPLGCWVPSLGVVDVNWTTRTFPNNVHWDYAFYSVPDSGAHQAGYGSAAEALDAAVTPMSISFAAPSLSLTHALGYSYAMDPQFMYCSEALTSRDADNWWLGSCGLTGGSSGGPWVSPMTVATGNGPIISVNSWGFTNQPGMAGPKLSGTSASCIFEASKTATVVTVVDGDEGVIVTGC